MGIFNSVFSAFLREAQFTQELLSIGVTQLRKANYSTKGVYYNSFVCLSTGFERIEKLCLILDYYITSNGMLPQEDFVRKHGHRITSLFYKCLDVAQRQKIKFGFPHNLDDEIYQSILQVLNDFSDSSGRYSNINILLGSNASETDCMHQWYKSVDLWIYEHRVSEGRKQDIEQRAETIGTLMQPFAFVLHTTEDFKEVDDVTEASKRTGIWEAVAPYRQLYVLHIIRFFSELLRELGYISMRINPDNIPYFGEIFARFYNDDAYFRSRKTWDHV